VGGSALTIIRHSGPFPYGSPQTSAIDGHATIDCS
jgi:hypothetical protein